MANNINNNYHNNFDAMYGSQQSKSQQSGLSNNQIRRANQLRANIKSKQQIISDTLKRSENRSEGAQGKYVQARGEGMTIIGHTALGDKLVDITALPPESRSKYEHLAEQGLTLVGTEGINSPVQKAVQKSAQHRIDQANLELNPPPSPGGFVPKKSTATPPSPPSPEEIAKRNADLL